MKKEIEAVTLFPKLIELAVKIRLKVEAPGTKVLMR